MKKVMKIIDSINPDVLGIFFDTMVYNDAIKIAKCLKKSDRLIIAGGPHASVMPESVVDYADVVIIGEGEETFGEVIENGSLTINESFKRINGLCYKLYGEIIFTGERPHILNLDTLPFPAFDLLEMELYVKRWHYLDCVDMGLCGTNLITSRGCPFGCTYCQPTLRKMFGQRLCSHSPGYIVDGIKYLVKKFDISSIFFHDDTITSDNKWLDEFCSLMISAGAGIVWGCNTRADVLEQELLKKMYSAGCRKFHIGAESASTRILKEIYRKGIMPEDVEKMVASAKKAGIKCFCFFMLGAPTETYKEMKQTGKFACRLPVDEVSFSITTPLPGTYIYQTISSDKRYTLSSDFSKYNYYSKRAFYEPGVSSKKIKFYQIFYLLMFYSNPKRWLYLIRHFISFKGIMKLLRKILRSI